MKDNLKTNLKAFVFFWKLSPGYWITDFVKNCLNIAHGFVTLSFTEKLLNALTNEMDAKRVITILILMVLFDLFFRCTLFVLDKRVALLSTVFGQKETEYQCKKSLHLSYSSLENSDYRQLKRRVGEAALVNGHGKATFIAAISKFFSNAVSLIVASILFFKLFVTLYSLKSNSWLFILLLASIFVLIFLRIWFTYREIKKSNELTQKHVAKYTDSNRLDASFDTYNQGKDIRLYHQDKFIFRIHSDIIEKRDSFWKIISKKQFHYAIPKMLIDAVQKAAAYLSIGWYVIIGVLPVGMIVSYTGYISRFSDAMSILVNCFITLKTNVPYLKEYLACFDYPEYNNSSSVERITDDAVPFSASDIHFRYENCENEAIKGISFTIEKSKKYAVVGMNGSGKTTLVKLLCHFYDVQSGEILHNGINIQDYGCEEYWEKISAVFQDYKLLSLSLRKNIALNDTGNNDRIINIFSQVGFLDRYQDLMQGLDSSLYKNFDMNGIEVSGGEAQKIAMARALYKDSDIIIFDEPTAALDPIAESEIYAHFNQATKDKTVIFISHRLASCKFCDEIIVMDGGKIVQTGTHEELIKDKEGLYNQLWTAQAEQFS